MKLKEKLDEIIAKLQLIKNEQEAANRELEKQSQLLNPVNKLTSTEAIELSLANTANVELINSELNQIFEEIKRVSSNGGTSITWNVCQEGHGEYFAYQLEKEGYEVMREGSFNINQLKISWSIYGR